MRVNGFAIFVLFLNIPFISFSQKDSIRQEKINQFDKQYRKTGFWKEGDSVFKKYHFYKKGLLDGWEIVYNLKQSVVSSFLNYKMECYQERAIFSMITTGLSVLQSILDIFIYAVENK